MTAAASTLPAGRLPETLSALLERKRMLDAAWVVCLAVALGAAAVPWFLSLLEINIGRAAWSVCVYAIGYLVFGAATDRARTAPGIVLAMRAMLLSSVLFLGLFWHLVGGLDNPMFLLVFALPTIMSGMLLQGWQPHATAGVSVMVVSLVALAESPDLRWYLDGLGFPGGHLAVWGTIGALPGAGPRQSGGPAYQFTILETFAAVQSTVAFLSAPLATLLVRNEARLRTSGALLTEVQGLFHAVLRAEPDPGVIVYADTMHIVQASDSFFQRMLLRPSDTLGKALFELVAFDQPEAVRQAFEAPSGELPFCVYRIDHETRIANLYFYRTEHASIRYLYVSWQEVTELYYLHAGFNALEDPVIVVGANERLYYANARARELFGPLHFGMDTSGVAGLKDLIAQHQESLSADEPVTRQLINGQPYAVHTRVADLPGDAEACTILWLHCVAREDALFEQAVRDPLTGLYNRRYFDDALARHVARPGRLLACAYFDLDNFKIINDERGHAAGDAALTGFVNIARTQLRSTDIFARLGGDEFAVLFVNCEIDVAAAAIERIRSLVAAAAWVFDGRELQVSFSAGLAPCHPTDTIEDLLRRTDRALYAAKESGKGRYEVGT